MTDLLAEAWPLVVAALTVFLSVVTAVHVVLYKRDVRAAAGWVGLVLVFPVIGPILYALLGINRIPRLASLLRQERLRLEATTQELRVQHARIDDVLPADAEHLTAVGRLVDRVTRVPVTAGNRVTALVDGAEAYPAMLQAIDEATSTVMLGTYIFDHDPAGITFADALERAVARGVEVRVLIDGVGALYSWPSMVRALRRRKVPVARFLHSWFPWRMPFMNLRSHRKVLVVDGVVGFTGGMNIREGHLLEGRPSSHIRDVHFRLEGPVVAHLSRVFAEDWIFTTREMLDESTWFPLLDPVGPVVARGITDGPDEDLDRLRWTILGAIGRAERRIRIMTPYFLPDATVITSLNVAAFRGVEVDIILPEQNNLRFVAWACEAQLWQLLTQGCRIHRTRGAFDHTKLMTVDSAWSLVGSANWDPRSLRLNFEFNVECYDTDLACRLDTLIDDKLENAAEVTLREVNGRSFLRQVRDGVARLFIPYL